MMKHVLLASVLVLFALLIPGWAAYGDVAAPDCETPTPPAEATGTPYLQTEYPSATPTDEWTPTSPPEWTVTPIGEPTPTVGVSPDPSPSATVTPRSPDGEDEPTPTVAITETLPVAGGGLPPNVEIGLIAIGTVVCVFLIVMARAGRQHYANYK